MINKIGKILIAFSIFFSIVTLANTGLDNKSTNSVIEKIDVMSELLIHQNYQQPDLDKFKEKIEDYFGSNSEESTDDFCLNHNSKNKRYGIANIGNFIYPCLLLDSFLGEESDKRHDKYVKQFIAYNKLLFNDDNSVKKYVLSKTYSDLPEIVINFNYEKDALLYETVVTNPYKSEGNEWRYLFYNKSSKGYRKRFLNDMLLDKSFFRALLMSLYVNWNIEQYDIGIQGKKVIISQSTKDKALIHIIKYQSHLQNGGEDLERSQRLAYEYLTDFFDKDSSLKDRLEKNNYYNMGIKVLVDKQKVISTSHNELLENHYYTKSPKKYINLLQKPDSSSSIIKKLPNNTEVIKLYKKFRQGGDYNEWLYVTLASDRSITGYIHLNNLEFNY